MDLRTLSPRDYLNHPLRFGQPGKQRQETLLRATLPEFGDEASLHVAWAQHHLFRALHERHGRTVRALVNRHAPISRSYLNSMATGHRWAGETVLAAGIAILLNLDVPG